MVGLRDEVKGIHFQLQNVITIGDVGDIHELTRHCGIISVGPADGDALIVAIVIAIEPRSRRAPSRRILHAEGGLLPSFDHVVIGVQQTIAREAFKVMMAMTGIIGEQGIVVRIAKNQITGAKVSDFGREAQQPAYAGRHDAAFGHFAIV